MSAEKLLLHLARRSRQAEDLSALRFILVNETFQLVNYRQAVLWSEDGGLLAVSGISSVDQNSPFALWVKHVSRELAKSQHKITVVVPTMLSKNLQSEWTEWLGSTALWIPLLATGSKRAGLLLSRDDVWQQNEIDVLDEWSSIWQQAWQAQQSARYRYVPWARQTPQSRASIRWWQRRWFRWGLLLLLVGLIPVPLTVLAPAEIVPKDPAVIRTPIDGVVEQLFVMPNQIVKTGQPLFSLDMTALSSQLQVAEQEMLLAATSYRQATLQSLTDVDRLAKLAEQDSLTIQRQLQADYLKQLLEKSTVKAPREGVVVLEDPTQWIGRPVVAGEKVMLVAQPTQTEIEAWLALGDAIELHPRAPIIMYLNANPFSPVQGEVRYIAHQATERPDGSYAYRVRATMVDNTPQARIGLRGTARLSGERVLLVYWVFRKPIVAVRQFLGI